MQLLFLEKHKKIVKIKKEIEKKQKTVDQHMSLKA